jgi:hypothetical protein
MSFTQNEFDKELDRIFTTTGVFELVFNRPTDGVPCWRAFYRTTQQMPMGMNYKYEDGTSPSEAVRRAQTAMISERLSA